MIDNPYAPHHRTFHASADRTCVVQHHPQANTTFAKQQGYVVIRLEPWVVIEHPNLAEFLAEKLNEGTSIK